MYYHLVVSSSLDLAFGALAHSCRRAIVERLARGSARATDLCLPFALSQQAVSKHLKVLQRAELVRHTKNGRERWYELERAPLDGVKAWVEKRQALWEARLDQLAELVEDQAPKTARPRRRGRGAR
jgi:DNA-binding transcriptional ArsR family regulator